MPASPSTMAKTSEQVGSALFWSVTIPTYKPSVDHLEQTLRGVLQQDSGSGRIDVVTDCASKFNLARDERLLFDDPSFDIAFLAEVLEHIPSEDIPNVLRDARRIALFAVPDCMQFQRRMNARFRIGHFITMDQVQFFSVKTFEKLLKRFSPASLVKQGDFLYTHQSVA